MLTNLLGAGSRPFTVPAVDGSILVNIGSGQSYDDPVLFNGGRRFIHELTHAWQLAHKAFPSEYL